MSENKLANLSIDFAVCILNLCDAIKGHYSIVNQIKRSATSIGANIREAKLLNETKAHIVLYDCGVIRRMLIFSINTAKSNTAGR